MNTIVILVLVFASTAILWLGNKAFRLVREMKKQERDRTSNRIQEKMELLVNIREIANNMLSNDLNLTEGSIRIKVLLDHLDPQQLFRNDFIAFYDLYSATEHMPRHKERDKYTCDDLKVYDEERERIEDDFRERVFSACLKIIDYEFTN